MEKSHWFARHSKPLIFLIITLAALGVYLAFTTPIAVFPETNFPRIVIGIDNGYGITGVANQTTVHTISIIDIAAADAINMAVANTQPGDVILMHDGDTTTESEGEQV